MDFTSLMAPPGGFVQFAALTVGALAAALGAGEAFYRSLRPKSDETSRALVVFAANAARERRASSWARALWLFGGSGPRLLAKGGELLLPQAGHRRLVQALSHSEEELWRRRSVVWPERYLERLGSARAKIIALANLTGGPAKAALAAGLAAHYATARGLKVLVLDMDREGGLSETLIAAAGRRAAGVLKLEHWLAGEADAKQLVEKSGRLDAIMPGARLVAPTASLGAPEAQLASRWMLGDGRADGRYVLAERLLSRAVQAKFDVVLINAPPRLSIGAINALAAATHLVIPTAVDAASSEAVRALLQLVQTLRPALFPELAVAGIALAPASGGRLTFPEQCEVARMKRGFAGIASAEPHVFAQNVPGGGTTIKLQRPAFGDIGDAVATRAALYRSL